MQKKHIIRGFSLIELLLAGALFVVFAWGVIGVLLSGLETDRLGEETTIATQYATEGIEAVRSIAAKNFDTLDTIDVAGLSRNDGNWEFSGRENVMIKYTRSITIQEVKRDGSGNIDQSNGDVDTDTRLITVEVSWKVAPNRNDSVVLDTYLTRFK